LGIVIDFIRGGVVTLIEWSIAFYSLCFRKEGVIFFFRFFTIKQGASVN
jgi:hypothetical protein